MEFITTEFLRFKSLFSGNLPLIIGDILILGLICLAGGFFVKYLKGLQIKRNMEKLKQRFFRDSEARELTAKKDLEEYGYKDKQSVLERLDSVFKQAGYISYENEETTETILIKIGIVLAVLAIAVGLLTHNVLAIMATIIIVLMIFGITTMFVSDKNYIAIEDEILRFINLADGYASESNDITYIIGKTYPKLKEPLYSYGKSFYFESIHAGSALAFQHFEEKISHQKFREIIHNIYICSKTNSNYKQIFHTSREIMRDYIDGKKERKNIKKAKAVDFGFILILLAWSLVMMDGIAENLKDKILNTTIGNVLMILLFAIIAVGAVFAFKIDKK